MLSAHVCSRTRTPRRTVPVSTAAPASTTVPATAAAFIPLVNGLPGRRRQDVPRPLREPLRDGQRAAQRLAGRGRGGVRHPVAIDGGAEGAEDRRAQRPAGLRPGLHFVKGAPDVLAGRADRYLGGDGG